MRCKLNDPLPTCTTGGNWFLGVRCNAEEEKRFSSCGSRSGKCSTLGAEREPIAAVFDIGATPKSPAASQYCCPNMESAIRRIRSSTRIPRCGKSMFNRFKSGRCYPPAFEQLVLIVLRTHRCTPIAYGCTRSDSMHQSSVAMGRKMLSKPFKVRLGATHCTHSTVWMRKIATCA
jgi:hypothetical protein